MVEYVFTFGIGHLLGGRYVRIRATSYGKAREGMCYIFGTNWCMQYEAERWDEVTSKYKETQFGEVIVVGDDFCFES